MIKQLKENELNFATWYNSADKVPPDGIQVLCTSRGIIWVDTFRWAHGWSNPSKPFEFFWSFPELPHNG